VLTAAIPRLELTKSALVRQPWPSSSLVNRGKHHSTPEPCTYPKQMCPRF